MTKGSEQLCVCPGIDTDEECVGCLAQKPHNHRNGKCLAYDKHYGCFLCVPVEPEKKCCGTCDNYNSDEMKCILSGYSTTYSAEVDKDKCWIPKVIKGGNFSKEPEKKEEKCERCKGMGRADVIKDGLVFEKVICPDCKGTGKAVKQGGVKEILLGLLINEGFNNYKQRTGRINRLEADENQKKNITKVMPKLESFYRKEVCGEIVADLEKLKEEYYGNADSRCNEMLDKAIQKIKEKIK